jgi:hypothetical protein
MDDWLITFSKLFRCNRTEGGRLIGAALVVLRCLILKAPRSESLGYLTYLILRNPNF